MNLTIEIITSENRTTLSMQDVSQQNEKDAVHRFFDFGEELSCQMNESKNELSLKSLDLTEQEVNELLIKLEKGQREYLDKVNHGSSK